MTCPAYPVAVAQDPWFWLFLFAAIWVTALTIVLARRPARREVSGDGTDQVRGNTGADPDAVESVPGLQGPRR